MKKLHIIVLLMLLVFVNAQNNTCSNAQAACPDEGFGQNIPTSGGQGNAESGPFYGCLLSQPNPLWYYLKVEESGDLNFDLQLWSQPNNTGAPIDVDFMVWGPFTGPTCGASLNQNAAVHCGYGSNNQETIKILNAQAGEYYMLLVTNYGGKPGYINLELNSGNSDGSFDCSIISENEINETFCDIASDEKEDVNLNALISTYLASGETVVYYSNYDSALNDLLTDIVSTPYTAYVANNPTKVFAQIKNSSGNITQILTINIIIDAAPISSPIEF